MQISNTTDNSFTELADLKSDLSTNTSSSKKNFNDLLTASISSSYTMTDEATKTKPSRNERAEGEIPSWVHPDFDYDPKNPRKPNKRELIEAISGESVEKLHENKNEDWQKINRKASDILYGVVGSNEDTRDWLSIMSSKDIITEAQEQTRLMFEPKIDIQSNFGEDGTLTEQIAIIIDNKGNTLRSLSGDLAQTEETLHDFGVTRESVPTNLEERTDPEKFDEDLLNFLKNFDNNPSSVQQIVVQVASEVIANKLSQEIPPDELAKL